MSRAVSGNEIGSFYTVRGPPQASEARQREREKSGVPASGTRGDGFDVGVSGARQTAGAGPFLVLCPGEEALRVPPWRGPPPHADVIAMGKPG